MSTVMLFYKKVTALSRDIHGSLRLEPIHDYSFAADHHWMPVAGVEFVSAARRFPIVFIKDQGSYSPVLVTGLVNGENAFVDGKGAWRKDTYIPAFVRRYPFVLADVGAQQNGLTVCIDEAYSGWNKTSGEQLFTKEGKNSTYLEEMLRFVNGFYVEMKRTAEFCAEVSKLDLLVKRSLSVQTAQGTSYGLTDVYIIDEQKIAQLQNQQLHKLNRAGMLGWIYAHLISLENLTSMAENLEQSRQRPGTVQ